jgi:hypothetical protein
MKKLMLILITIGTTTLFAQHGTNSYYGGAANTNTNAYVGVNAGVHVGVGVGVSTGGGAVVTNCAPAPVATCAPQQRRVRWEDSPCGTFRWRIEEVSYWVPGQWTYYNGYRTWTDGYMAWDCVERTRVYNTCGQGCGHSHGHGHGHGHGHSKGHGHGHHR